MQPANMQLQASVLSLVGKAACTSQPASRGHACQTLHLHRRSQQHARTAQTRLAASSGEQVVDRTCRTFRQRVDRASLAFEQARKHVQTDTGKSIACLPPVDKLMPALLLRKVKLKHKS